MSSTDRTEQLFQFSVVILLTLHHPKEKEKKTKQNKEVSKLERVVVIFGELGLGFEVAQRTLSSLFWVLRQNITT